MSAASPTAPMRRPRRCANVQVPTGPVRTPWASPPVRIQPRADANAPRVRTAVTDGPVMNAAAATTSPTTRKVRSAILMNRTSVSNAAAAASLGSVLFGTLFR